MDLKKEIEVGKFFEDLFSSICKSVKLLFAKKQKTYYSPSLPKYTPQSPSFDWNLSGSYVPSPNQIPPPNPYKYVSGYSYNENNISGAYYTPMYHTGVENISTGEDITRPPFKLKSSYENKS
jgi:hypothetical protein